MAEQSVTHSTFVIERSYPTTPDRVFAAFAEPDKKRRWMAPNDGPHVEFEMDFRVGGSERRSFRGQQGSPMENVVFTNQTFYQDILPNRRIVIAYTMAANDQRISASQVTFELLPTAQGTELIFTEQSAFFEGADGAQMRENGWRHLLERLAKELAPVLV